jgi:hypothetical protein
MGACRSEVRARRAGGQAGRADAYCRPAGAHGRRAGV